MILQYTAYLSRLIDMGYQIQGFLAFPKRRIDLPNFLINFNILEII